MHGVLPRSMSESLRSRPPEQLSPYEAVLRSFGYFERYTPEELAAARSGLEAAVRKAPAYADAWAMLSYLCAQDYGHGFDLQPDSLEAAASAARRAVELGAVQSSVLVQPGPGALRSRRNFRSFRNAAERAVALNPMDGNSMALLGELLIYAGDLDRGLPLAERAKQLNPHHRGMVLVRGLLRRLPPGRLSRRAGLRAQDAICAATRSRPCSSRPPPGSSVKRISGSKAVRDLLKFRPELAGTDAQTGRKDLEPRVRRTLYRRPAQGGARDSGGRKPPRAGPRSSIPARCAPMRGSGSRCCRSSTAARTPSLTALAEGLTEEIVTGLSRFSYLRVISRTRRRPTVTSARQGARRAVRDGGQPSPGGTRLRVAVQLVDAASGAHLWAENYERAFQPGGDLRAAGRAGSADRLDGRGHERNPSPEHERGIAQPHTRGAESLRGGAAQLRLLRAGQRRGARRRAGRPGVRGARRRRTKPMPGRCSPCCASRNYAQGFELQADPLASGSTAARNAVEAAPSSPLAAFRPGPGALLPEGIPGLPQGGGAGDRAQSRWTATPSRFSVSC